MFDLIVKKDLQLQSKKSYNFTNQSAYVSLSNSFLRSDQQYNYLKYYLESSPVFTAIRLIVDNLVSIKPILRNKKTGDFIDISEDNTGILQLLSRPNPFTSQELFYRQLVTYYILTGNSYINQIGNEKRIVELNVLRPQDVTVQSDYTDGYAGEYRYNSTYSSLIYKRGKDYKDLRKYRFYSENKNEINQLINFNPNYSNSNLLGVSDLSACEIEISQYLLASIHNNSLLQNQARPSGLLTYRGNNTFDEDFVDKAKEMIRETFSGAGNAGKTAILDHDFHWQQMSESIKDMDFATLKNQTELSVYKALKVPMSYATNDASTYNNKEISKLDLYDNAVIPLRKTIDKFLTDAIMYRYDENLEITFDPAEIETLNVRRIKYATDMSKMAAFSRDEIRNIMGYPNTKGGEIIYQPQNLVASGTDSIINNDRESLDAKARFIKNMKDGGYEDEVISQSIKKWF